VLKWASRAAVAGSVAAVLLGCGGGGGGSEAAPPALTFTPSTVVAETDTNVATPLSVVARASFSTSSDVYVVIEGAGVIGPTVNLTANPDGTYSAAFSTDPALAAGRHRGDLIVHVCPVANCAQEFPGSPVRLPYDLTVGVVPNLTALQRLAGAANWETHQGSASHVGHVPASLDASRFSVRWRWVSGDAGANLSLSRPVAADDTVYVVTSGSFANMSRLLALNERDATARWSHDFGNLFAVNAPAVSGGAVYVASSGHQDTAMWSFSAADGSLRFRSPFGSQWEHYDAPVVVDGMVYANAGSYGGMQAFDATTGGSTWFTGLQQFDQWSPAVDATNAYATMGGQLYVVNRSDGSIRQSVTLPNYNWTGWASRASPVLPGDGTVLARSNGTGQDFPLNPNALSRVDAATGARRWTVSAPFVTDPVVAGGVVYVANASPLRLEARSLANGELLWNWPLSDAADTRFVGNLVVTDTHVFVSSQRRTYAVDLRSHASVWTYRLAGYKAISSNGILYISTLREDGNSDGGLAAINLH
jgi:outer membrane protein assembly factor BamB